jgi:hypothetical protein
MKSLETVKEPTKDEIEDSNIERIRQTYTEHQRVSKLPAVMVQIIEDPAKYTITLKIGENKLVLTPDQALDLAAKLRTAWYSMREENKKLFKKSYHGRKKHEETK